MTVLILCGIKVGDAMQIKDICKMSEESSFTEDNDKDSESHNRVAQEIEDSLEINFAESSCPPQPAASWEHLCKQEPPCCSSSNPTESLSVPSPFLYEVKRNRTFFQNFELVDKFSPAVSLALEKNSLTGLQRNEFIRDICTNIMANGIHYLNKEERNKVALAIITKYPHLKDTIGSGLGSWSESIRNRFKHVRKYDAKKRKASEPDNFTPGTSQEVSASTCTVPKKRRNDFWNVIPSVKIPEEIHSEHVAELKKETDRPQKNQDKLKIGELMIATYAKRRGDILTKVVPIQEIVKEYPPLATMTGIRHEFCRLLEDENCMKQMSQKLSMYESAIVRHCEQLPKKKLPYIKNILRMLSLATSRDAKRTEEFESTLAVVALPKLLGRKLDKKKEENDLIDILTEDGDFNDAVRKATFPKVIGVGDDIFCLDRLVVCAEGSELVDVTAIPIKTVLLSLHAMYYVFSVQYPPEFQDMFLFMDSVLLGLQHIASNKIAVQKFVKDLDRKLL